MAVPVVEEVPCAEPVAAACRSSAPLSLSQSSKHPASTKSSFQYFLCFLSSESCQFKVYHFVEGTDSDGKMAAPPVLLTEELELEFGRFICLRKYIFMVITKIELKLELGRFVSIF